MIKNTQSQRLVVCLRQSVDPLYSMTMKMKMYRCVLVRTLLEQLLLQHFLGSSGSSNQKLSQNSAREMCTTNAGISENCASQEDTIRTQKYVLMSQNASRHHAQHTHDRHVQHDHIGIAKC